MLKYHPYLLLECRQTDRCQTEAWSGGRQTDALEWRQANRCPLQQNHKPYDVQLGASHNPLPFLTSLGTYVLLEP